MLRQMRKTHYEVVRCAGRNNLTGQVRCNIIHNKIQIRLLLSGGIITQKMSSTDQPQQLLGQQFSAMTGSTESVHNQQSTIQKQALKKIQY